MRAECGADRVWSLLRSRGGAVHETCVPEGSARWGAGEWQAFLDQALEGEPPTFFLLVGCEAGVDASSPAYAILNACEGGWEDGEPCEKLLGGRWRAVVLVEKDIWWEYRRSGLHERVDAIGGAPAGTGCDALAVVLLGILRRDNVRSLQVVPHGAGFLCRATCAGRLDLQDELRGVPGYGGATVARADGQALPREQGFVISANR